MQQKHSTPRLELEPLESRTLLATGISLTTSGVLQINGTRLADSTRVSVNAGQIVVQSSSAGDRSPTTTRWNAANVHRILFQGSEGNDAFTNETAITSTAYGGAGN